MLERYSHIRMTKRDVVEVLSIMSQRANTTENSDPILTKVPTVGDSVKIHYA